MEYKKPSAEVIDIENEDIVTASCNLGDQGSQNCIQEGRIGADNSYVVMQCGNGLGKYTCNQSGVVSCNNHKNGITCNANKAGKIECTDNIPGGTTCNIYIGANSL